MLWFLKYFRRKIRQKISILTQNKAKLCKILIITLVFEKNANFSPKMSKIAENCDHNIDPWSPWLKGEKITTAKVQPSINLIGFLLFLITQNTWRPVASVQFQSIYICKSYF
jgi:hypothetical protein